MLKRYCKSGIWVHDGKAEWFDDIDDAIEANKASQPSTQAKGGRVHTVSALPEHMLSALAKIKQMQNVLTILTKALNAPPINVQGKIIPRLIQEAKYIGIELLSKKQISDCGYQLRTGMIPLLQAGGANGQVVEYFDMATQCEKIESAEESGISK
jgi:hypothetical protein